MCFQVGKERSSSEEVEEECALPAREGEGRESEEEEKEDGGLKADWIRREEE